MRALRIAGIVVLALVGLTLITFFIWVWVQHRPNDAVRQFQAMYEAREAPDAADNAFFDVFGILAPPGEDAHTHGERRLAWLRAQRPEEESSEPGNDPSKGDLDFSKHRSSLDERLREACSQALAVACARLFASVDAGTPLNVHEDLVLSRYETLLDRGAWFEPEPWRDNEPLPPYRDLLLAQRLFLARVLPRARAGDVLAVRDALHRDLAFYRRMLASADGLIAKMSAVAAARMHFTYGNLVLRELPRDRVPAAVPDAWRAPITDAERNFQRTLAGEVMFMNTILDRHERLHAERPLRVRLISMFSFNAVPRMRNRMAREYQRVLHEFAVPFDGYPKAFDAFVAASADEALARQLAMYLMRVGSVEGMRRAALLVAELRSRGVGPDTIEQALREGALKRPFDGEPFAWRRDEQAVVHEGPEETRRAIALYY